MVTTGPAPQQNTHPTAPLDLAYWVLFRRGDYHHGPAYTGTYGFDWVEWKRNSANNPHTAYDDLVSVTGTTIGNYVQCYNPGLAARPAQPAVPAQPAPPAPPATAATPPPVGPTPTQPATAPPAPVSVALSVPAAVPLPATLPIPARPAIPAKPGIAPHYAAVSGLYKQYYQQKLHEGYDKLMVQGNDYYVPILSLRPHQTVTLKLKIEFLNKNPLKPTNLFTVAPHADYLVTINGQTNNATPAAVPAPPPVLSNTTSSANPAPPVPAPAAQPIRLPPVNKQVLSVTIESLRPSAAAQLRVEDEHGNLVGQLNIADNTTVYELPLRVVYVLKGLPMNPKDPLDATPRRALYAPTGTLAALQGQFQALRSQGADFITFLNQHSLNQAHITCTVVTPAAPYQLLIDLDQWKKDGLYSTATGELLNKDMLADYCGPLVNALYGAAFAAFQGITIYVFEPPLALTPEGLIAASGSNRPVAARALSIFQTGLTERKASTIAHEIGHVLGLTHAFPMPAGDEDQKVQDMAGLKEAKLMLLPGQRATLAKILAAAATPPTPADQAAIKAAQFDVQLAEAQLAEASAQVDMYASNPFKFTKKSTNNLMDYDAGDSRCSLWHWQWSILQSDVTTYYGTKSLAR